MTKIEIDYFRELFARIHRDFDTLQRDSNGERVYEHFTDRYQALIRLRTYIGFLHLTFNTTLNEKEKPNETPETGGSPPGL